MNKKLLFAASFALIVNAAFSQKQGDWCGLNDNYIQKVYEENPGLAAKAELELERIRQGVAAIQSTPGQRAGVRIIPVVVHVFHFNGDGNISTEQIEDGIRILNEDFRRLNPDTSNTRTIFKDYATDPEFEFRLAKIDPNGNCTDGIVRINTPYTYDAGTNVKNLGNWPKNKYFNVWIVKSIEGSGSGGTILGKAWFPWWGFGTEYGFLNRGDQWGSIGSSGADGRTATHEIGHCFGLMHTFQGSCGSSCSSSGDEVCDTPPVYGSTWTCSSTLNTCSNDAGTGSPYTSDVEDQIENYMSYDNCQNMFSLGQKARMDAVFTDYSTLINLTSSANLIATGTNDGYVAQQCAPKADFLTEKTSQQTTKNVICEGESVTFTDISWNGSITGRTWSFQGADVTSAADSVATATYSTAGTYEVSLKAENAKGSDTEIKTKHITVLPAAAAYLSFSESFKTLTLPAERWGVSNTDNGITWEVTKIAGNGDTASLRLRNHVNVKGQKDEFISAGVNLTGQTKTYLSFKTAFAHKTETVNGVSVATNDKLYVYVSKDCGKSWSFLWGKSGTSLSSKLQSSEYTAPATSDWKTWMPEISSTFFVENLMFKFQFEGDGGNNIYLDDIMIANSDGSPAVGVEEETRASGLAVYPNPTKEQILIDFNSPGLQNVTVELFDVTGKRVFSENAVASAGGYNKSISLAGNAPGIYFLKITSDKETLTRKVVKH